MRDKRRNDILDYINKKGFVKNSELAIKFDATITTIISDINSLSEEGMVTKVYGGAKSKRTKFIELSNEEKTLLNTTAKIEIAQQAAGKVENGNLIFIDTGTTTIQMCSFLVDKDVSIVTNGYLVAKELIEMGKEFILVGGNIRPGTGAIVGSASINFVEKFHFSKSFIGANAYDSERIYITNIEEALFKEEIIKNSDEVYVLADNSKKDKTSSFSINRSNKIKIISN